MNSRQATVSKILTYSCVDGPGNRLVLFLQGCNFACPTCHNPHTRGVCNDCGDCIPACHTGALTLKGGRITFDAALCDSCDACLRACPISANPMIARLTVDEVLAIARAHRAFLSGITVSGGEATMQIKFVTALFQAIKSDPDLAGLSCFIDSNGHLGVKGWAQLLPHTDGVMLDIKAFEPALHSTLTGQDNRRSRRSAQILAKAGKLYELRFLLIPGQTDSRAELDNLADFAKSLGQGVRIRLNAFQTHGVRGAATDWPTMTRAGVETAALYLREKGLGAVITPAVYL